MHGASIRGLWKVENWGRTPEFEVPLNRQEVFQSFPPVWTWPPWNLKPGSGYQGTELSFRKRPSFLGEEHESELWGQRACEKSPFFLPHFLTAQLPRNPIMAATGEQEPNLFSLLLSWDPRKEEWILIVLFTVLPWPLPQKYAGQWGN